MFIFKSLQIYAILCKNKTDFNRGFFKKNHQKWKKCKHPRKLYKTVSDE